MIIFSIYTIGCSFIGGSETNPVTKPVAKLETELKTVKEDVDKSKKEINDVGRSEEHTSELQSHSFISYAVFCLKKKKKRTEQQVLGYMLQVAHPM